MQQHRQGARGKRVAQEALGESAVCVDEWVKSPDWQLLTYLEICRVFLHKFSRGLCFELVGEDFLDKDDRFM